MKTKTKALCLTLAAVVLVAATFFGTMAYLTSTTETVNNTFTVGKVKITLDEAKVDDSGNVNDSSTRVTQNTYKLMPGHTYVKDPTVHFKAGSEASWLFVEVKNGIADIESKDTDYKNIDAQIKEKGWTALTGVTGVYYKEVLASGDADVDYPVFANFKIDGSVDGTTLETYAGKTVEVTAYAVQKDGFDDANTAWTTGLGK